MEVADLGVSRAEALLADVLRQRLAEVKRAFYGAALARQELEIVMEQRRYFDDLVKFNQVRLEEGAVSGSELLKVKLERVNFVSPWSTYSFPCGKQGSDCWNCWVKQIWKRPSASAGTRIRPCRC